MLVFLYRNVEEVFNLIEHLTTVNSGEIKGWIPKFNLSREQ